MRAISAVREAISPMRYGTGFEKAIYWFIRVAIILVPIFIVAIIAGVIYCKVNGIEIAFPG